MNTEYVESLRSGLLLGLNQEYPHLTKSACEAVVQCIMDSQPTGLLKQAGLTEFMANPNVQHAVRDGMGAAAKAGVALMVGGGLYGLNRIARSADTEIAHSKFQSALRQVLASNDSAGQIIKSAPMERVNSLANTIFSYAPNVATDVNLLKTLLATYVNSEGIDPSTIRSLQELEMNRQKINTWKPADLGFKG